MQPGSAAGCQKPSCSGPQAGWVGALVATDQVQVVAQQVGSAEVVLRGNEPFFCWQSRGTVLCSGSPPDSIPDLHRQASWSIRQPWRLTSVAVYDAARVEVASPAILCGSQLALEASGAASITVGGAHSCERLSAQVSGAACVRPAGGSSHWCTARALLADVSGTAQLRGVHATHSARGSCSGCACVAISAPGSCEVDIAHSGVGTVNVSRQGHPGAPPPGGVFGGVGGAPQFTFAYHGPAGGHAHHHQQAVFNGTAGMGADISRMVNASLAAAFSQAGMPGGAGTTTFTTSTSYASAHAGPTHASFTSSGAADAAQGAAAPAAVPYDIPAEEEEAVFDPQASERPSRECVVCLVREPKTVVMPCFHNVLCVHCARLRMEQCPVCRKTIEGIKRIYG
eukprot:TRINITY_DN61636_c0_g1_i1.p1 TRINITY_DN61636_c0_g1~~TRINITY_DN61636_c0_g1_i1.p1  ORF type:complete len:422 (+),score=82.58 TRINITY_DN61636_c0_g1_i1:77-1267(+)